MSKSFNFPAFTEKELQTKKQDFDLVKGTAYQIQKDFQLFHLEISFSGDEKKAYRELFSQILPVIDRLLNLDSVRFFSLLYAIDVSEKKINSILFGRKECKPSEEITELILQREFMKVLTRKVLSQPNNSTL